MSSPVRVPCVGLSVHAHVVIVPILKSSHIAHGNVDTRTRLGEVIWAGELTLQKKEKNMLTQLFLETGQWS